MPTPPSSKMTSVGVPPLPTAKPVKLLNARLTETERATLVAATGWQEGDPIPSNAAEILEQHGAQIRNEVRRADAVEQSARVKFRETGRKQVGTMTAEEQAVVDRITAQGKAVLPPEQPIESLPSEKQAEIRAAMSASLDDADNNKRTEMEAARLEGLDPSIRQGLQTPAQEIEIEDDTGRAVPEVQPAPSTDPVSENVKPTASATGAAIGPTHCPHCNWDLKVADIPEPEYASRMAFLHSVLGGKPYVKEYDLFDGAMTVGFRTLTGREIDFIYKCVFQEKNDGKITNDFDFYERINRLRLFVQLQSVKTGDQLTTLPDGLTKFVSPSAKNLWKVPQDAEDKILLLIEDFLTEKILAQEIVYRVLNTTCNMFNRTVAKLEAMVDNKGFWKATPPQS